MFGKVAFSIVFARSVWATGLLTAGMEKKEIVPVIMHLGHSLNKAKPSLDIDS